MAIDRVYVDGDYIQFRDSAGVFVSAIHYSEFSYANDSGDILFMHRRDAAAMYPITRVNFLDVKDAGGTPYVVTPQTLDDFLAIFVALLPAAGGGGGSAPGIATYEIQLDADNNNYLVRVLTVFDPITNVPTRSFFELDGVTPYVPDDPDAVINADAFLKEIEQSTSDLLNNATKGQSTCKVNMRTVVGADTVVTQSDTVELQVIAITGTFDITDSDGLANVTTFPVTAVGGGIIDSYSINAGEYRTLEPITIDVPALSTVLIIEKS